MQHDSGTHISVIWIDQVMAQLPIWLGGRAIKHFTHTQAHNAHHSRSAYELAQSDDRTEFFSAHLLQILP